MGDELDISHLLSDKIKRFEGQKVSEGYRKDWRAWDSLRLKCRIAFQWKTPLALLFPVLLIFSPFSCEQWEKWLGTIHHFTAFYTLKLFLLCLWLCEWLRIVFIEKFLQRTGLLSYLIVPEWAAGKQLAALFPSRHSDIRIVNRVPRLSSLCLSSLSATGCTYMRWKHLIDKPLASLSFHL